MRISNVDQFPQLSTSVNKMPVAEMWSYCATPEFNILKVHLDTGV